MVYDSELKGKNISLVPVETSDADFIVKIRNDVDKCRYLHKVSSAAEAQARWIEEQRSREGDYYFLIKDLNGKKIGTIGLSNIADGCGETSRFVSYGSPLENVEANLLITDFAFDTVGLKRIRGYVCAQNKKVISLQKRFGYLFDDFESIVDGMDVRFATLTREDYRRKRSKIVMLLEKAI